MGGGHTVTQGLGSGVSFEAGYEIVHIALSYCWSEWVVAGEG